MMMIGERGREGEKEREKKMMMIGERGRGRKRMMRG